MKGKDVKENYLLVHLSLAKCELRKMIQVSDLHHTLIPSYL